MSKLFVAADLGYDTLKTYSNEKHHTLRHTVKRASEQEWQAVCETQASSLDAIKVDGVPYLFGDTAIRRGFVKAKRAERYVAGYYDIQFMRMIVPFLRHGSEVNEVWAGVSYPPADWQWAKDIRNLIGGERIIELPSHKQFLVNVAHVMSFPELGGGCANFKTTTLATDARRRKLIDARSFLVDIGGGTTDLSESQQGFIPNLSTADSLDIGASSIMETVGLSVRGRFKEQFRSGLREDMLQEIFKSKQVRVGRGEYESVAVEVEEAVNIFFADLDAAAGRYGGLYSFSYIGLSGGGADLLADEIHRRYGKQHEVVLLGKRGEMQFANVEGGYRLLQATAKEMKWQ